MFSATEAAPSFNRARTSSPGSGLGQTHLALQRRQNTIRGSHVAMDGISQMIAMARICSMI